MDIQSLMKPTSKKYKKHKRRYDNDIKCSKLEPGGLDLVRQKILEENIRFRTG